MRMTRADIEAWYQKQPIPKLSGIVFRAMEDDGRLIMGVYKGRKRQGLYILNPDGKHAVKSGSDPWCYAGTYTLFRWSVYWGNTEAYDDKKIKWADKVSREIGERLLAKQDTRYTGRYNIVMQLRHIEERYNEKQRDTRERRKQKKIDDFIDSMPDLPCDLAGWVQTVVFEDAHYMFGRKGCDDYYCTACGEMHHDAAKAYKDRQRVICDKSGKRVKVEKRTNRIERNARIQVVQNMPDGTRAVSRHIEVVRNWFDAGMTMDLHEQMVLVFSKDGRTPCHEWYYHVQSGWNCGTFWTDRNCGNYRVRREYLYPHTVKDALDNTVYGRLGLEVAAARGWELQYNNLMMAWRYGQTEYLIKGGFRQLVSDISDVAGHGAYANCICEVGTNVKETLMLNGQSVARLRQADGGIGYLRWLREEEESGEKIPERQLRWLGAHIWHPNELDFAAERMSSTQIANYLEGQQARSKLTVGNLIIKWRDYLRMAERLHLDTKNEMIFRPKDLKARHAELVEIIDAQRDRLEQERIEGEYPAVAPTCARIRALYEWRSEHYLVMVPSGAADIMREGRLLRHCVGSTDRYFDRIAEGESYIMFLRKASAPDTPWYTMEVEPGGKVRQLRTMGDDEGKDRSEAKAALRKWQVHIQKALRNSKDGEREISAAEVSREKRLQEFEELRRGGNIIRNGRLAGRLLVEVLEADFKEYNEDAAAVAS